MHIHEGRSDTIEIFFVHYAACRTVCNEYIRELGTFEAFVA